jgi:hypothetical protein|tara:strand:- start:3183 stop:3467 length:285 start_codon:yes stop_codon:yes gene_type:complete
VKPLRFAPAVDASRDEVCWDEYDRYEARCRDGEEHLNQELRVHKRTGPERLHRQARDRVDLCDASTGDFARLANNLVVEPSPSSFEDAEYAKHL